MPRHFTNRSVSEHDPVALMLAPASQLPTDLPAIAGGIPVRPLSDPLIFGAPAITSVEIESVSECLRSKWIGNGARVRRFEQEFARYKNAAHAVAVSSGTAALHLSMVALGIGPGDEVIAPTMTFCSTVHAIVHSGAIPVLVDCQRETFNLHPDEIERRITSHTKAIVVVHMAGRCCEMNVILDIARRYGLIVIEDCAHAIEATYKGQPAGLMGDVGCFSFYPTKNVTTGDGGMAITGDAKLAHRIKLLSLHGMTSDAWSRTAQGKSSYQVVEAGYKCNMTYISAAIGIVQLAGVEDRSRRREQIWNMYGEQLRELPLVLPAALDQKSRHAYHLYSVLIDTEALPIGRARLAAAMAAENIGTGIHYVPVHMQPYYRQRYGFQPSDFPNASYIGRRTISLPLSAEMTEGDVLDVCEALTRFIRFYTRFVETRRRSHKMDAATS